MSETVLEVPAILEKPAAKNRLPAVSANVIITATMLRVLGVLEEIKRQDLAELDSRGIALHRAKKFGASILAGLAVSKLGIPADVVASASSKH